MNTANFLGIPAGLFPEQEAVRFQGRAWSYGELWEEARRLASGLRGVGVQPGQCVAVLDTNSDRYVTAYYATAAVGGVFLPLNYRAKPPELEFMIASAGVRVLFVGDRYVPTLQELLARLPERPLVVAVGTDNTVGRRYEELLADPPLEEAVEVDDEETAILMYTSGTTAQPKAVLLTHGDFSQYVTSNVELADGTPRGTALVCVPLYHIAGATNIMTNVWTGRRMVLLPQFEAGAWLETVERERVTHAFVVPTMLKQILDHPDFPHRDLSSLEVLSYGGAPMPFPVIRRAIEVFPRSLGFVNAFGQTETTSTLTVLGPEDHRLTGSPEQDEIKLRRLRSIGRPLPDVELIVVDEEGRELPRGEVGEIWVRTPRVMKGYRTASGVESPLQRDGWLPTRDMGWIDEDGYVFLAGRKDDMIIRGGENIAPAEVESTLFSHPAVEDVAVIGVPDVEWGQRVAAFVVRRPGSEATAEELIEFCRQRLASFKKPDFVYFVSELPKNPLGKVLRRDLRERWERGEFVHSGD
ncbi:MAG: long-chain-fatty-acid--CoA ligase [Candidatus Binatia bacterium]|nr:long-chain-fatty-acid--CoA ligase [Candidatus Binatia bacterium]